MDRDFARLTEPHRRELFAHCYRMLGSVEDAEDLVQETYLRAWRAYGGFAGRSSVRVWLYQIATNACLTALQRRGRRALPSGLAEADADGDVEWLQPVPDALVADPAVVVAARDSLRLALIASLQYLPPRQRAVLILREVLAFSAAEVAETLDTSVAAVKSTLQRARARLREVSPAQDDVAEPVEREQRDLLDRYIAAFENADPASLEQVLREDAILEVAPSRIHSAGLVACMAVIRDAVGSPGDWQMERTSANGQPAVVAYLRGEAFGVSVLTMAEGRIGRISVFAEPDLVEKFGHPLRHPTCR